MPSGERRESFGRQLHRAFKAVESAAATVAATTGTTTFSKPTGTAGKTFTVPAITSGSVNVEKLSISDVTITNGEVTAVVVSNSTTVQTAQVTWTFFGFF